jgi:formylglycine-generating enzyme required for sulfatase activity
MGQPCIFVSYSRKDRDITQRLVSDLHQSGAEVWVDVDGIQSGNFMQAIDKALAACDWMVLVLSPNAIASDYVPQETYTALHRVQQGYMKAVIPVLVAACRPGSIPPQWDVLQRYDATQDYSAALAGVLRAVGLSLLGSAPHPAPAQSNPAPSPLLSHAVGPAMPPDRFPPRLTSLGYEGRIMDGIEVILPPLCDVPAGAFLMGSDPSQDKGASSTEQPQQWVTVLAFQIAGFPVTVAEYACFVRTGHAEPKTFNNLTWQRQRARPDHPVVNVTWHDAASYTAWLARMTGQPWRLPSEAEWEKAARWDSTTRTSRIYPWGDTFDKARCNTSESGIKTTSPVGSYPSGASPYSAQDMAGNVWEWTSTMYKPYPYNEVDGREDTNSPDSRVLRGGSWGDGAGFAHAAYRGSYHPGILDVYDSFRVVRAAPSS